MASIPLIVAETADSAQAPSISHDPPSPEDHPVAEPGIPREFVDRMRVVHGAEGVLWAHNLRATIDDLAPRWSFTLGATIEPLSYSFVAAATASDGTAAILRVGYPDEEQRGALRAMVLYRGEGAARVIEHDYDLGAMLLERVTPGTPLSRAVPDDAATVIAARAMKRLWRQLPAGHEFYGLRRWTRELADFPLDGAPGFQRLPRDIVVRAQRMLEELLASEGPPVLLHGDLHHENILDAGGGRWLAIDPKGLAGEREFDIGAFMMNPIPGLLAMDNPREVLERRLDTFTAELGLDSDRLRAWTFVYPVLSACWSAKGGDGSYAIRVAEIAASLLAG